MYGTLVANTENLLPEAQGGGLAPLLPSRFTGQSRWATAATLVTPPAPASPTVAFPGQPQYGLQQSPNYGPVIGYGAADTTDAGAAAWSGSGGYAYTLLSPGIIQIRAPSQHAGVILRPGTKGYRAILEEAVKLSSITNPAQQALIRRWLDVARVTAETQPFPYKPGTAPSTASSSASSVVDIAAGEPPADLAPPSGMPTGVKVAIGVLAVSAVVAGVMLYRRRR